MYGNAYGTRNTVTLVVTLSLKAKLLTYVRVQISVGTTIILAENFRGFPRFLQANTKTLSEACAASSDSPTTSLLTTIHYLTLRQYLQNVTVTL